MSAIDSEPLSSGSGSDPFPAFSQRRRRGVRVTTAAAVALGLALGGGAIASATTSSTPSGSSGSSTHTGQPPFGGTPPAAVGTVKSVGSDTFTITSRDNTTVTVNVGTTTTYFDQGVTSPTFANVTVGEHVAVFGTDTSDTVTATKVAIGTPKGGPGDRGGPERMGGTPPSAVGTVKSVGSDTFTITSRDNTTVTVNVGSTTTYFDQGVTSPTFANVTVGEHVAVFGTDTSDTVTATKVAIGTPEGGPGRMGAPGGKGVPDGDHDGPPSGSSSSSSSWSSR